MFIRCQACHLHKTSPQVGPDGDPDSRFVIIPEAPGEKEVLSGRPLDGPAGKLFDELLMEAGMEREDVFVSNTTYCLPPKRNGNRTPTDDEASFCFNRHTLKYLKQIKPIVAIVMGRTALKATLNNESPMKDVRGKIFSASWCKAVIPTWHPSYFLRSGNPQIKKDIVEDLEKAIALYRAELEQEGMKSYAKNVERHKDAVVEDKAEMIRNLERRPVEGDNYWNQDRKYFAGWSDGEEVVMIWRDEQGKKRHERIPQDKFKWYFYVETEHLQYVDDAMLEKYKNLGVYRSMAPDVHSPKWTRVYAQRFVTQTRFLKEKGEIGVTLDQKKMDMYPKEKLLGQFLDNLKIPHYEADLTPRQRFMTEYDIRIEDTFRELYFDLETDDRQSGFMNLEDRRILSIGYKRIDLDGSLTRHCLVLEEDTNRAEEAMLQEFKKIIESSDILYAWNGFNFDFPIIRARMAKYRIDFDWRLIVWCDLLSVWRRYFQRAAAVNVSFSLGDIGMAVLHTPKLDWKAEAILKCAEEKCQHEPPKKMYDLWRLHPDLLRSYNMRDVDILADLEKEHGFAKIDQTFCRIGNCLCADFHISTKIDMLLLKKGYLDGIHFPTRLHGVGSMHTRGMKRESGYSGAFVFEPEKGMHEDVAALDFKSLYPSMMVLFNISPDSFVPEKDRHKYKPEDLIWTPTKSTFQKQRQGFIPQIFNETLQKRKVYQQLQMGEVIGSDKFLLYYRLSYAFKRLGLSFYGEMGNKESRYFNPKVAEAVTLSGQFFIKGTRDFAIQEGYRVLYGDTDSVYIKMNQEQAVAFCKATDGYYRELAKQFNTNEDKWIVELEYENHFKTIFFVTKKRYAGLMYYFKGKPADYLEVKGLEFMRSDGAQYGRTMQKEVMELILRERPDPAKLKQIVFGKLKEVLAGKLPPNQIRLTQAIEKDVSQYKSAGPHVRVAAHIKEVAQTEYYVGMKVPYIITDEKKKEAVWEQEYDPAVKPYDAYYLWNKKVYPPSMRVLECVYPDVDWKQFLL